MAITEQIEQTMDLLREILRKHRAARAEEMQPLLERRAASKSYDEGRYLSQRLAQIDRAYAHADKMLVKELVRLEMMKAPAPIIVTASPSPPQSPPLPGRD